MDQEEAAVKDVSKGTLDRVFGTETLNVTAPKVPVTTVFLLRLLAFHFSDLALSGD